jgi:membrane protein implicated in regulation of membrane protease activity
MFLAYLFMAVAGAILLAASLFGGGEDHDLDHGSADGDVDPADSVADSAHATSILRSFRFWTYLLAFGGFTGVLLRTLAGLGEPWTALLSFGCGAVAALFSQILIRKAVATGPSGTVKTATLVGRSGAVLVPFERGATGKIRVQVNDTMVDLLATTDDDTLGSKDEVLIVEVRDGTTAHVTRSPERR